MNVKWNFIFTSVELMEDIYVKGFNGANVLKSTNSKIHKILK